MCMIITKATILAVFLCVSFSILGCIDNAIDFNEVDYCFSMCRIVLYVCVQWMRNSCKLISIDLSICNWSPSPLFSSRLLFSPLLFPPLLFSSLLSSLLLSSLSSFLFSKWSSFFSYSVFNIKWSSFFLGIIHLLWSVFIRLINSQWIVSMINCGKLHRYSTDNSSSYWLQCVWLALVYYVWIAKLAFDDKFVYFVNW